MKKVNVHVDPSLELIGARTVPLPGGVVLTSEEQQFRDGKDLHDRSLVVARSILTKVRNACAGDGT